MCRLAALAALAVSMLCVVLVTPANAHNGVGAAFKGRAGNYIVYAYDGELLPNGRLNYRLVLVNGKSKNPVYDARPTVTASRAGASAISAAVETFGNVFFYNLPNPYPRDWDVHLRIAGPLGTGSVDYLMHGVAPSTADPRPVVADDSGSSGWPYVVGGIVAAALAAFIIFRFLRHASTRVPTDHPRTQED